ncbi:PRANC domain protein [Orientia chuto str. Dubai]|uniref:PRANC domain protein n=1 Tax=Orientia chuto str. Dubai TaxID=1359168 RepID=A0A0F3MKV7_9RICK|nr:PRANC domain-containing protein [Candidatus Orientia mediorientalis]KJV56281.1 PRANC domain protein [Orientia chuto str. Dubai]
MNPICNTVLASQALDLFKNECEEEISKTKNTKIGGNSYTIFDVCFKSGNMPARCVNNPILETCKNQLRIYKHDLEDSISKLQIRSGLLLSAVKANEAVNKILNDASQEDHSKNPASLDQLSTEMKSKIPRCQEYSPSWNILPNELKYKILESLGNDHLKAICCLQNEEERNLDKLSDESVKSPFSCRRASSSTS